MCTDHNKLFLRLLTFILNRGFDGKIFYEKDQSCNMYAILPSDTLSIEAYKR